MNAGRYLLAAHPARGLLESWLIGLPILFLLFVQVGYASPFVLTNGILLLCAVCSLWAVLRIRLPGGGWLRQATWEGLVGACLSLVMAIGYLLPAHWLGWDVVWTQSTLGRPSGASLLLLGTGPGYLIARIGLRLWLRWDQMRHKRLRWALTHAHLTVVAVVILFALAALLVISLAAQPSTAVDSPGGFLAIVSERLLHTVFPALGLMLILAAIALAALLPPSALVSFLVARKTTRRLEALAEAVRALRQGHYDARLEVIGEDEVAQLQADFNVMAGELQRTLRDLEIQRDTVAALLRSRRDLIASVSHELRTPVATMRATLESSLSQTGAKLSPPLRHDLEIVESELLRLQRLIDDLFVLSQTEVDSLAIECRPTDVAPLIGRMVETQAPLAWDSGRVEVVADLPEGLPPACLDAVRFEQVLANLLRNAVHYTPPGGIVAVVARAEPAGAKPETVIIEVRDTGQGIAPHDLPHIWERFYQGEGNRAGAGAGLGLAIVKELTGAMGGTVDVHSQLGQGSCFTLTYPSA
jgi:signal transduction histidine kinase